MCGIVGMLSTGSRLDPAAARVMTDAVRHRGPDDEGYLFVETQAGRTQEGRGAETVSGLPVPLADAPPAWGCDLFLGHRRLSILDPTPAGHQPMGTPDGKTWIAFNGEIYNFREIRRALERAGCVFRSRSDTEVILWAYRTWGIEALRRLNGIFAFALWDGERRKLLLARDPFGVKPLYVMEEGGIVRFASEAKAVLTDPSVPRRVDPEALTLYLAFRYVPSPATLFRGIRRLRPGHWMAFDREERGWKSSEGRFHGGGPPLEERSERAWTDEYARVLEGAIVRQMVSDVPVGCLLSGGVDSALVAAVAARAGSGRLKTYTVGFEGGAGGENELAEAAETARLLGTDHHEVTVDAKTFLDFLPRAVEFMDEPVASSSALPLYFVCRRAREDLKVVLTGQGADEPLAGYPRYVGEKLAGSWGRLIGSAPVRGLLALVPRHERWKRAARSLGERDPLKRFLAIYALFTDEGRERLLREPSPGGAKGPAEALSYWMAGSEGLDPLSRMLRVDTRMWLPDDLLLYGDKMSMAASVEARVPLLDLDLVDLIERMPSRMKLRGLRRGKHVHKEAALRRLPRRVVERPKKGFPTPVDRWFRRELAGEIRGLLTSEGSACGRYFRREAVEEMIGLHQAGREDFQRQLYALLVFELWHRAFRMEA